MKSICLICLVLLLHCSVRAQDAYNDNLSYIYYVKTCAENLINHGLDHYGKIETAMWASIIDTRDYSIPEYGVPPTTGVRNHDRAQGGSNLYQDVTTIKVFYVLTKVLNDGKFAEAADNYIADYFKYAQSPQSGLLGWGEHLYYHFYGDTVSIDKNKFRQSGLKYFPHELLGWTPPWQYLWNINPEKTKDAILGLKHHYNGDDPKIYLFNRHANYFQLGYSDVVMPWIKHSGLFSYSFAFLYNKTGDTDFQYWSRQCGDLYWNLRNSTTNLTLSCLFHGTKPNAGKKSSISGTCQLAYWLYKSYELSGENEQKIKSLLLLKALETYHWNNKDHKYYESLPLDGKKDNSSSFASAWKVGYGSSSIMTYGIVSAYFAKKEDNPQFLIAAKKVASIINSEILPKKFTAQNVADAMNLNLDVFELSNDSCYLNKAEEFGKIATKQLWYNGMFVRESGGDKYYESKLAIGDLLKAFLRISLLKKENGNTDQDFDWSF